MPDMSIYKSKITELINSESFKVAGLCLAIAFILYFPSLTLPWSLVDDGRLIHSSYEAFAKWKTAGPLACLWELIKVSENNFGPAFRVFVALQRVILGNAPWAWHFVKILSFALVLGAIWELTKLAGGGYLARGITLGFFALFSPQFVYSDFQTWYANFARLLTTDSYQITFALWATVFLLRGVFGKTHHERITLIAFNVTFCLCCLTKITSLHIISSFFGWMVIMALLGQHRSPLRRRLWKYLISVVICSIPGILYFHPWGRPITGYENVKLATSPSAIWQNISKYRMFCTDSLGYLWYLALLLTIVALIRFLIARRKTHIGPDISISCRFLLLLLFLSGFVFLSMWPLIFPRYMLTFAPYLCILMAVEIAGLLSGWLGRIHKKANAVAILLHFTIGGALFVVMLFPYYYPFSPSVYRQVWVLLSGLTFLTLGILGLFLLWRKHPPGFIGWVRYVPVWILAGALSWQGIVLGINTYDSAVNYCAYERAYSSLLTEGENLNTRLPENTRATIYTNLQGEQFGSSNFLLHDTNIAPFVDVKPLPKKGLPKLGTCDRIFIIHNYNAYGTKAIPAFAGGNYIMPLLHYGKPGGAYWVKRGEQLVVPFSCVHPFEITHLAINTDPFSWPTSLDIRVLIKSHKKPNVIIEIARFEGINMSRSRMGPKVLVLKRPFVLPAGKADIVLRCEVAPRVRFLFSRPAVHFTRIAIIKAPMANAKEDSHRFPQVLVWGHPVGSRYKLYRRRERKVYSLLLAAPSYLIHVYQKKMIGRKGWFVDSLRRIRYDYVTELYGPPLVQLPREDSGI